MPKSNEKGREPIEIGMRIRFSVRDRADDAAKRPTLRPGEVWEGIVVALDSDRGRTRADVRIERLNGMLASGTKRVWIDWVFWERK